MNSPASSTEILSVGAITLVSKRLANFEANPFDFPPVLHAIKRIGLAGHILKYPLQGNKNGFK